MSSILQTFGIPSGAVYLDVEGVPDREFYYLIGMRYRRGDQDRLLSFWADDPSGEREIWVSLYVLLRRSLMSASSTTGVMKHNSSNG